MIRKQIAAANWKMNLKWAQAEALLHDLFKEPLTISANQYVALGVPFPYLSMALDYAKNNIRVDVAAQNASQHQSGAYTGETSAEMLQSMGVHYVILGHSERREYFGETNALLAEKVKVALQNGLVPIFCCGESLDIRESGSQNQYVANQLKESLFDLSEFDFKKIVIAYEPIWAIGTGKTATAEQAQEMHAHLRAVIAEKYGSEIANGISILYGGSVKGANAKEIFGQPDVDGGLVGGASLKAEEFLQVIAGLKNS